MQATKQLPEGWERVESEGPYYKLIRREAVTVPKISKGEGFQRDAVVIVTDDLAGVVKGPGARQSWQVDDPDQIGIELAHAVDEWVNEGGDPYGGKELDARLEEGRR